MFLKKRKAQQKGFYLIPTIQLSKNKYIRWKKIAQELNLSKKANQRLDWIIYYHTKTNKNASLTCRHFGIKRSHWYYWKNKFDETKLRTLENQSTKPNKNREKEYTPLQYERVVKLRKKYLRYGKEKILRKYKKNTQKIIKLVSGKCKVLFKYLVCIIIPKRIKEL